MTISSDTRSSQFAGSRPHPASLIAGLPEVIKGVMNNQSLPNRRMAGILGYWRACLADSSRLNVSSQRAKKSRPVQITTDDNASFVPAPMAKDIVQAALEKDKGANSSAGANSPHEENNPPSQPADVFVCPIFALPRDSHAVHGGGNRDALTPTWIPDRKFEDGRLEPSGDRLPWVPRDLLEPSQKAETLGSVDQVGRFVTANPAVTNAAQPDEGRRWSDAWDYADRILQALPARKSTASRSTTTRAMHCRAFCQGQRSHHSLLHHRALRRAHRPVS